MPTPSANDADATSPLNQGFTEGGDLVLRSSDDVNFHVHSILLSLASPVFSDMFTVGTKSSQDIVPLGETAEVLALVLKFIYPSEPPSIPSLEKLDQALRIADKYQVKGMMTRLREQLSLSNSSVSISTDPLRAFLLACAHGFREEAEAATLLAAKQHSVEGVDTMVRLTKLAPSSIPFIRLVGIPLLRAQILSDVLFKFYQKPMQLNNSTCRWTACSFCYGMYYSTGLHSAPEWQARWANAMFAELKDRPVQDWNSFFKVEFFHTSVVRKGPFSFNFPGRNGTCGCAGSILANPDGFEQWSMSVFDHLKERLQSLDELERMTTS